MLLSSPLFFWFRFVEMPLSNVDDADETAEVREAKVALVRSLLMADPRFKSQVRPSTAKYEPALPVRVFLIVCFFNARLRMRQRWCLRAAKRGVAGNGAKRKVPLQRTRAQRERRRRLSSPRRRPRRSQSLAAVRGPVASAASSCEEQR